jgi:4-hydroxybenzoate polyprenyltransferase
VIRDLLLLARAPLAAGALSNLAVGVFLTWPGGEPGSRDRAAVGLLALTTLCLYWAGMVLNDWWDRERDARLHPRRPIPSGRIDAGVAALVGASLLGVGLTAAGLAGLWSGAGVGRGLLAGGLVAASVLVYDGWLKRYRLVGSAAMATCRLNNVLMPALALGLAATPGLLLYAGLLFLYVLSLTILSTFEDEDAPGGWVALGSLGCLLAPGAVAAFALSPQGSAWALVGALPLMGVIGIHLLRTMGRGTRRAGAQQTRALLKGLWLLDLSVILLLGLTEALLPWAVLYACGFVGAKLLFGPPPPAAA